MKASSTNYYTWFNGETLTASLGGETVFYCHDANKNVTDLVDTSGDSVAHYEYSPFGVITEQTGTFAGNNPFRFSNEYFDDDIQKVVFLYRFYDPWLGKFLSRDPIGKAGGLNLYGFVQNEPINSIDLLGLQGYAVPIDPSMYYTALGFQTIVDLFSSLIPKKSCSYTGESYVGGKDESVWDVDMGEVGSAEEYLGSVFFKTEGKGYYYLKPTCYCEQECCKSWLGKKTVEMEGVKQMQLSLTVFASYNDYLQGDPENAKIFNNLVFFLASHGEGVPSFVTSTMNKFMVDTWSFSSEKLWKQLRDSEIAAFEVECKQTCERKANK